LAVGNGFIASYGIEAAVGSFPMATLSVQGLNTASYSTGSAQRIPAVDPSTAQKAVGNFTLPTIPFSSGLKPSVIRPGDVKVTFSNAGAGLFQTLDTNLIVQKASFNFDFNLEAINKLGARMSISREVQYPVDIDISIEALMGDLTAATGMVDFMCSEPTTDITFDFYKSACGVDGPTAVASDIFAKFIIKNAKLTSQDLSGSIGPSSTVTMKFLSQIGASNDTANGLFFSGVTGYSGASTLKSL
jgi:hypothetical protein